MLHVTGYSETEPRQWHCDKDDNDDNVEDPHNAALGLPLSCIERPLVNNGPGGDTGQCATCPWSQEPCLVHMTDHLYSCGSMNGTQKLW